MNLENSFQNFGFSLSDAKEISSYFVLKHYSNGEFFLKDGMTGKFLGFVENGLFQFYYDNDPDEITTYIAFRNEFILSIQSFFADQPSKENIKALVDSDVWIISQSDFGKLRQRITGFKEFYINVLEHLLVCIDESRFDYITLKPEERYKKLIQEEPVLVQKIPLKYLSSLIGVTPRHLSRIRNHI